MAHSRGNCIWRKAASASWLGEHAAELDQQTRGSYAIVDRPHAKRLQIEAFCETGAAAGALVGAFGGSIDLLSSGWQARYFSAAGSKPIRVGARLVVAADAAELRQEVGAARTLIIPASAAFGTGEHATTAMSLRMLERTTRRLGTGWRMLDAGTGSGILALAGRCFGAGEVIAIDNDALAVSVAKQNARANKIRGVTFVVGDVNRGTAGTFDIIAANLYSELLVWLLPAWRRHLHRDGRLILSGVLRRQEAEVTRALRANDFAAGEIRRRGKWIALMAAYQKAS
ncbi:MAG TPA: 50S ribosomal protein L11 methyltransferase, partial [Chthoniobacterales bacterium]|nr:50S ribosomal protein L11 methyltransferase [Chthoniobacterales bacterium]